MLFDQIGLVLNIKTLVERFENQNDFMVTTDIDYQDTLATSDELQLYRIIQEALSNAIKYANAHAAKITLQATKQQLLLEIRDNGKGFDVEKHWTAAKLLDCIISSNVPGSLAERPTSNPPPKGP